MTKKEIEKIVSTMKHHTTKHLQEVRSGLESLEAERDLTKRMWFWSDFGNSSSRRNFAKRYDREIEIKLGGTVVVRYSRTVSPSRKNAYASDSLWAVDEKTGKQFSFTVADAKKLVAAIDGVLEKRENKPEKSTGTDAFSEALEMLETVPEEEWNTANTGIVETRQEAYHDVVVYADGHEERYYIGD